MGVHVSAACGLGTEILGHLWRRLAGRRQGTALARRLRPLLKPREVAAGLVLPRNLHSSFFLVDLSTPCGDSSCSSFVLTREQPHIRPNFRQKGLPLHGRSCNRVVLLIQQAFQTGASLALRADTDSAASTSQTPCSCYNGLPLWSKELSACAEQNYEAAVA